MSEQAHIALVGTSFAETRLHSAMPNRTFEEREKNVHAQPQGLKDRNNGRKNKDGDRI